MEKKDGVKKIVHIIPDTGNCRPVVGRLTGRAHTSPTTTQVSRQTHLLCREGQKKREKEQADPLHVGLMGKGRFYFVLDARFITVNLNAKLTTLTLGTSVRGTEFIFHSEK